MKAKAGIKTKTNKCFHSPRFSVSAGGRNVSACARVLLCFFCLGGNGGLQTASPEGAECCRSLSNKCLLGGKSTFFLFLCALLCCGRGILYLPKRCTCTQGPVVGALPFGQHLCPLGCSPLPSTSSCPSFAAAPEHAQVPFRCHACTHTPPQLATHTHGQRLRPAAAARPCCLGL